jgi:hypothetical protein
MGTRHLEPQVSMHVYLDYFGRKCYLVDDESFKTEEFVNAYDFQDAMLEIVDNGSFALNHYNC